MTEPVDLNQIRAHIKARAILDASEPVSDAIDPALNDHMWVCSCGCYSFVMSMDGTSECTSCGRTHEAGAWTENLKRLPVVDEPERMFEVIKGDPADLSRARLAREMVEEATIAIIVLQDDGYCHSWGEGVRVKATPEGWDMFKARLERAVDNILGERPAAS